MRLTAILLTVGLIQVHAAGRAQHVTISGKDMPLKQVFAAIEKQTGYVVLSNKGLLPDTVKLTISLDHVLLRDALDLILKGQPLKYVIQDRTIFISRKPGTLENTVIAATMPPAVVRVTNAAGKPLAGASVLNKRTKRSGITGAEGTVSLQVSPGDAIEVSYIGFVTATAIVKADEELLSVIMQPSDSKLDEVQVMAYGTTSRRLSTGNITTVKAEDIQKQPVNNPLLALQGRVPGLLITPSNGLAGSAVTIELRGRNSLNFQADPLIVIDNIPVLNNIRGFGYYGLGELSSLSFLNPNDIASIEVLKDSDATSIYGSRGANGVILITTRKGKAGETKIDLNAKTGWADVPKMIKMMNTEQYLELRKEAFANSNIDIATLTPQSSNFDVTFWDQNRYTDWQKELIGNTAMYNDVQATVSGGTESVQYTLGGAYHRETTVFPGSNADQRGSAHFSLTGVSPNKRFRATGTASYMMDNNKLPGTDLTYAAMGLPPNAPALFNPDGTLNWEPLPSGTSSFHDNPMTEYTRPYESKINKLTANIDVSYKLLPSLTLRTTMGYDETRGSSFKADFTLAGASPESLDNPMTTASSSFSNTQSRNASIEPQLSYINTIGNGKLEALFGASYQSTFTNFDYLRLGGFTSDALIRNYAAANPAETWIDNASSEYKYAAVFARLIYNHNNTYVLSLNARRDGSSRFGPGRQFGNFGSAGAAWIFSNETFVQKAIPFLSFGKLRFSYGTSGNDGIAPYGYLEFYFPLNVPVMYQQSKGYITSGLFNENYHWETTRKMEAGLEAGFLKDRILVTAAYFRNRSSNQLIHYPLASFIGPGAFLTNLPALIENKGLELTLSTDNIKTKDFKWSTTWNYSRNRNKLVSYPDIANSSYYQSIVGLPFYGIRPVYKSAGVDPQTGKYQFMKADGSITFDPEDFNARNQGRYIDLFVLPRFYGGLGNTFTYKGLSLELFFQYNKQVAEGPNTQYIVGATVGGMRNLPATYLDRWRKPGDQTRIGRVFATYQPAYAGPAAKALSSDFRFEDASFIRLKNLSLSYNIPAPWRKKMGLHDARIYAQGQNLLTFSPYSGNDPETRSTTSLPSLRVLTVGVQLVM